MTDLPETFDYENNPIYQSGGKTDGFYVMDRNLGATDTKGQESYGLLTSGAVKTHLSAAKQTRRSLSKTAVN